MPDSSVGQSVCPVDGLPLPAPAILCSFHWLALPRELSDRVRREFCAGGAGSEAYRQVVAAAVKEARRS